MRGRIELRVFYGWEGLTARPARDHGFGQNVTWDIPLLDGYDWTQLENDSRDPGPHHFGGIASRELTPEVERWGPDAVLVIGWCYRSHLEALRFFKGRIPVLFRGDSTLLGERPGPRRLLRRTVLTWVYSHVDVALHVGSNNRRYFLKHGLAEHQLAWVPQAVENERFADADGELVREAARWRAELGIPADAKTIVFVGKLESQKAPEVLLGAFARLTNPSLRLLFIGSGPLEASLRAAAAGDPRVGFLGFQNQSRIPVAYRLGSVLVLPSRSETWGLAVNEAMACGLPVIVSDRVGCAPDLVADSSVGRVFPAGDESALAAAIEDMLNDGETLRRMGAEAATRIRGWSIEEAATRIEEATLEVANRPSRLSA